MTGRERGVVDTAVPRYANNLSAPAGWILSPAVRVLVCAAYCIVYLYLLFVNVTTYRRS